MTEAQWDKPGPGSWDLDRSHCSAAPGPIQRALYRECIPRGMEDGLSAFGSPLRTMDMSWVNGKFYRRLVPLVGGRRDLPDPPAALLWLATRIHPAFRRAERRAGESFASKRWCTELRQWDEEWRPLLIERALAFHDVNVEDAGTIDDRSLARHLGEVHDHLRWSTALHFRLHVSDMGPLGNLMVLLEDLGLHRDDTFRAMAAASPATRGPADLLRALAESLRAAGVDPAAVDDLDSVRAASDDCAERLDTYLRFHGWRLTTGYDLEDRCLAELPGVVVQSIRAAARPEPERADDPLIALRAEIPQAARASFDDAVTDARASYGLRDENGPLTYEWPAGLLRRALLEAGRRLDLGSSVFELTIEEVTAALQGGALVPADEIERRAAERRWWATLEAPAHLGRKSALPPVAVMPEHLGRITRIVLTVVDSLEADPAHASLQGTGVGSRSYVGVARVVRDATEALDSVQPGDVVVTPYTAPTYNAVLALAGGLVTEEGGLLCHAAVIARELDLPAVIGTAEAMAQIPDGATIEVDPVAGRVRVLG